MNEDCKEEVRLREQICCENLAEEPGIPLKPTRAREIHIRPLNRGFVVNVDCHAFAFEDLEKMLTYISQYLRNPNKVEEMWFKGQLFNE